MRFGNGKLASALLLLAVASAALGQQREAVDLPLVLSASNSTLQGFVRIINRSDEAGTLSMVAVDDAGRRSEPIELRLDGYQTMHFNSDDLEMGNPEKGIMPGVGGGTGDWRLELESSLNLEALAYARARADRFLTSLHDLAPGRTMSYRVATFNPGSNLDQVSHLRLINPGASDARVLLLGVDDQGTHAPRAPVLSAGQSSDESTWKWSDNPPDISLMLPAGQSRTFSAQQLEDGHSSFEGRLGDGQGKWQLFVSADQPIQAMSLLRSLDGTQTNLSTTPSAQSNDERFLVAVSMHEDLTFGPTLHRAADFARHDINVAGGNMWFVDGDLDEDYFDPNKDPVVHLRELIDMGIQGLIGPLYSTTGFAVFDAVSDAELVAFMIVGSDHISELNEERPEGQRFVFRTVHHNHLEGDILADLLEDNAKALVVFQDAGEFGWSRDLVRGIEDHLRIEAQDNPNAPSLLGEVSYERFRFGDENADSTARDIVANKIEAFDRIEEVDAVIMIGYTEGGKVMHYMMQSDRVPRDAKYYVASGLAHNNLYPYVREQGEDLNDPETLARVQARVRGVKGTTAYPHSVGHGCSWERRFPGADVEQLAYTTHVYDSVVAMALASLKARSTNPAVYVNEVAGVTREGTKCGTYASCRRILLDDPSADIDYDGLSGPLEIGANGNITDAIFAVYTYDGMGGHTTVEEEITETGEIRVLPTECE